MILITGAAHRLSREPANQYQPGNLLRQPNQNLEHIIFWISGKPCADPTSSMIKLKIIISFFVCKQGGMCV
jgi:hypothetical protein